MNKSFKVFAFDGLRGYAGDYRDELAEARYNNWERKRGIGDCRRYVEEGWFRPAGFTSQGDPLLYRCPPGYAKIGIRCPGPCGGYWCRPVGGDGLHGFGAALRSVGSQPGQLAAGSLVHLIPEQGPVEDGETTPWTTRFVHNCTGEYGTVRVPLAVNRQVLLRTVIDLPVEGSPAQGLDPAFVRPRGYTTVSLREPVTLESVYNTAHTGSLFGEYPADIDIATLGEGCKGAQTLGVDVQVALPERVLLEVVEAAPGSTAWLLPKEPVPPVVPEPPSGPSRSSVPTWVPVVGGLGLLLGAGWLIFGGKRGR